MFHQGLSFRHRSPPQLWKPFLVANIFCRHPGGQRELDNILERNSPFAPFKSVVTARKREHFRQSNESATQTGLVELKLESFSTKMRLKTATCPSETINVFQLNRKTIQLQKNCQLRAIGLGGGTSDNTMLGRGFAPHTGRRLLGSA